MGATADLAILIRARDQATGTLRGVGGAAEGLGKTLDRAVKAGALAAGAAIAGLGIASTKMALDFEKGVAEVRTLLPGLSEEGFQQLQKDVLNLSRDVGIATSDVIPALYQAISAGVPQENVFEFMEVASKASIGGVTDLQTAVDGLTTVINAFRLPMSDAGRVADIFFTAVRLGKTTMGELSASMSIAAPLASALGVSIEEVAAAVTTLTKQGIPTAQAMTQVRAALVALQRMTPEMEEAVKNLGFATGQAALDALGFQGTIEALRAEADRTGTPLVKLMESVEALQAVLGLTGQQAEAARLDLAAMGQAAGAADAAFNTIEQTASRQLQRAMVNLQTAMTELGLQTLPFLADAANTLATGIAALSGHFGDLDRAALEASIRILEFIRDLAKMVLLVGTGGALIAALTGHLVGAAGLTAAVAAAGVALDFANRRLGEARGALRGYMEGAINAAAASATLTAQLGNQAVAAQFLHLINEGATILDLQKVAFQAGIVKEMLAAVAAETTVAAVGMADVGETGAGAAETMSTAFERLQEQFTNITAGVDGLRSAFDSLLGLPTIESAEAQIELSQLRQRELELEAQAEEEAARRRERVENLRDRLSSARREGDDQEADAIQRRIDRIEAERGPAEEEIERIQRRIEQLQRLNDQRRLERDILRARADLANANLMTDQQVLETGEGLIGVIATQTQNMRNLTVAMFEQLGVVAPLAEAWARLALAIGAVGFVPGFVPQQVLNRPVAPMAHGGIVTRPTLAMLGEGGRREAVIPLEGGGFPVVINLTYAPTFSTASPDEAQRMAEFLAPALRRQRRLLGGADV